MRSFDHHLLVLLWAAALAVAQEPAAAPGPTQRIAQAENLGAAGKVEDAILLLWGAIGELAELEELEQPGPDAERRSASVKAELLLGKHDPSHAERQKTHALVARLQAGLATMYRRKKWYDTAVEKLQLAERFDRDAARKERIAFNKVRSKLTAKADPVDQGEAAKLNELFDRGNTTYIDGPWRLVDDQVLECGEHDGSNVLNSWLTKTAHEDGEIVLELHPADPKLDRNAGLIFGAVDRHNYYCARFGAFLKNKFDSIEIYQVKQDVETRLCELSARNGGRVDPTHRLVLHIRGSHLRFQVDNRQPIEADTGAPVRGLLGLCVGVTGYQSCAVRFPRFEVGPLPGARPTAADLEAQREARTRSDIKAVVDLAKGEIEQKRYKAAALRLRQVRYQLRSLPADAQRLTLAQSIGAMIVKADRQQGRRAKAEQQCADALVALADKYAAGGMPRAAFEIVAAAAEFAPLGLVERESRAQRDVDAWRAANDPVAKQETSDGGAALREWFTEGRGLYSQSTIDWALEGPSARIDSLRTGGISALMPRDGLPPLAQAAITVRLPSIGAAAGFCLDVAGSHDFAVARLERIETGLVLTAQRWRDKKWTRLASEVIELPAANRDGWFEVEIEATGQGLVARSAGKTVTVGKALLGAAAGRYGLVVTNSGKPATIELRGFRFTK